MFLRILKRYFPPILNYSSIYDYIICHDLPEAITGNITKFEGISNKEIKRVNDVAINYLSKKFSDIIDFNTILNNYENMVDLESKVVNMIDKVHSSTTFIKYQTEKSVNMNDPRIISSLRQHPFVVEKINEGKDLADIFYEFHMKAVVFTEEELKKYDLVKEQADKIVEPIKCFAEEMYNQKLKKTLFDFKKDFPENAMIYNKNK